jgi:glycosyltransferase involved in cell wall biosynthesis
VPALPTTLVEQFIDAWVGHYLSRCHVVVVPSSTIGQSLREKYGLVDGVHVIPTGLDLSKWHSPVEGDLVQEQGWSPDDRILVSAGRLAEEKNWECLLAAFAQVLAAEPRARLIILGEGVHRKTLEALARQLGVEGRLQLPGIVSPDQVLRYFKAARLFCFSSLTETQGLVTLEAMASGLPVAAVRASGTQDIVLDGENGLLSGDDPAELAQAILSILGDEGRRDAMAARAVETAEAYDANRCAARMVEIYLEAGERQREGRHLQPVLPKASFEEPWRKFLEPWTD